MYFYAFPQSTSIDARDEQIYEWIACRMVATRDTFEQQHGCQEMDELQDIPRATRPKSSTQITLAAINEGLRLGTRRKSLRSREIDSPWRPLNSFGPVSARVSHERKEMQALPFAE